MEKFKEKQEKLQQFKAFIVGNIMLTLELDLTKENTVKAVRIANELIDFAIDNKIDFSK